MLIVCITTTHNYSHNGPLLRDVEPSVLLRLAHNNKYNLIILCGNTTNQTNSINNTQ